MTAVRHTDGNVRDMMTITFGEIMSLVGLLSGFVAVLWKLSHIAGKLESKIDNTADQLSAHKLESRTYQTETRAELKALKAEVDHKAAVLGESIATIGGYLAAKFERGPGLPVGKVHH